MLFSPYGDGQRLPGAPRYGDARAPLARRDAGRRARRRRALQARPDGLRAVEALEAERAGLAEPGRHRCAGAPGLAYRMLGDVDGDAARAVRRRPQMRRPEPQYVRHSRRRNRSRLSPPRERDRPILLRLRHSAAWPMSGCTTASCRSKARRCRRASATSSPSTNFLHTTKFGGRKWSGEALAARDAAHALPPADRLDGEGAGGGGSDARPMVRRSRRRRGDEATWRRRRAATRWRTISTRRTAIARASSHGAPCRLWMQQVLDVPEQWPNACARTVSRASANLVGLLRQTRSRAARVGSLADASIDVGQNRGDRRRTHRRARARGTGPNPTACAIELAALGVAIKDNKDGTTTWEPKR